MRKQKEAKKTKDEQKDILSNFLLGVKFRETLTSILNNKSYLFLPGIFDILLLSFYGFISRNIWVRILEHVQAIAFVAQNKPSEISKNIPTEGIIGAFAGDATAYYLRNFLLLLLILTIITYFLYCLFQSSAWYFAKNQDKKETVFYKYLLQFFRINILWFILFLIYYSINVIYGYTAQRASRFNQATNASLVFWSLIIFLTLIAYFAFISYGLIGNYRDRVIYKRALILGIRKVHTLMPMFLIIIGVFITINYLLKFAALANEWIAIIFGFILTMPALAFTRLYLIKVIEGVDK